YLAPVKLRTTTLTLIYPTVPLASWTAGSREVACSIGATLGNGGWATLLNSAKGQLLINGQPPVPPPDVPEERLTLPPIPLQVPAQVPPSQAGAPPEIPPNNQHLPGQQPVVTPPQSPASDTPAPQAPPPADAGAQPQAPAPADGGAPPPANPAPEAPPAAPPPGG
ncbi:MAG: septum formation family protein, partial [Mycobacterium sp.]